MKFLVALILVFNCVGLWSADREYKNQLKHRLATQAQEVFYTYEIAEEHTRRAQFIEFPEYDQTELNAFLQSFFGDYYDGYNVLIHEYVQFFSTQPVQHIRAWFGLFEQKTKALNTKLHGEDELIDILMLSQICLQPSIVLRESTCPYGLSAPISARYGLKINALIDERYTFDASKSVLKNYFNDLKFRFAHGSLQLAALVLGSNTVNKARVHEPYNMSYWDLYPFLNHRERDFYPAMLAAAFVWSKRKQCGMDGFAFRTKWETTTADTHGMIHLDQAAEVLQIDKQELRSMNANYHTGVVPEGFMFDLPVQLRATYSQLKDSIYLFSRSNYFSQSSDSCYVFYRTHRGDYFRDLTRWFGPQLNEIKELNGFKSNTLPKYWDVFFKVPCADSAEFAAFDTMSRSQKDAFAKGDPIPVETIQNKDFDTNAVNNDSVSPTGKKISYVVKSGDTLWGIGQKYKVSDADIMKWNNIGTNIKPGQKLILYLP